MSLAKTIQSIRPLDNKSQKVKDESLLLLQQLWNETLPHDDFKLANAIRCIPYIREYEKISYVEKPTKLRAYNEFVQTSGFRNLRTDEKKAAKEEVFSDYKVQKYFDDVQESKFNNFSNKWWLNEMLRIFEKHNLTPYITKTRQVLETYAARR